MKDKLLKMLKAKEEARAALVTKSDKSEDVAELRGINGQLETINTEIAELRSLIDGCADDLTETEETRTVAVNADQLAAGTEKLYPRQRLYPGTWWWDGYG